MERIPYAWGIWSSLRPLQRNPRQAPCRRNQKHYDYRQRWTNRGKAFAQRLSVLNCQGMRHESALSRPFQKSLVNGVAISYKILDTYHLGTLAGGEAFFERAPDAHALLHAQPEDRIGRHGCVLSDRGEQVLPSDRQCRAVGLAYCAMRALFLGSSRRKILLGYPHPKLSRVGKGISTDGTEVFVA